MGRRSGTTRRQFLFGAAATILTRAKGLEDIQAESPDTKRPNFVFILTDDQRWDAMSCAGHPFLWTPNIDRLAKEGARFTNAFVTTALCSPSRGSFLSGQYAHRHGVINNSTPWNDRILTMPMVLQSAGYDTAFIGKWHMDSQEGPRPGFNHWVSFKGQGPYRNPIFNVNGELVKTNGYMTDLLTEYALKWLEMPRSKPFCLYMCHKAVHGPFTPAYRHSRLYEDVQIPRPKSMSDTLEGKPSWVKLGMEPGHDSKGALSSSEGYDSFIRDYCRTLMAVDESVGRILDALKRKGVLDDTVIVFASDNGYFHGEHGRLDKRAMYEESIRIPFLMRYPRIVRAGTKVEKMVLNIDLAPTFVELAGLDVGRSLPSAQGRSLMSLLTGKEKRWRDDWLYEYFQEKSFPRTPSMFGVRTERWKYVEYPETEDKPELYDLKNDPFELHNLIDDRGFRGVIADMRARLQRLLRETGYQA